MTTDPNTRVYPPSGMLLSAFGVILNDQPTDMLLQVIEWLMSRDRLLDVDRLHADLLQAAMLKRFDEARRP